MICGPELHLPVYVRAHTRMALESPRKSGWEPKSLSQWAKDLLAIDCETTIGLDQKLNFGFWRWCKLQPDGHYACQEEGIFYRNDLDNNAIKLLREYARTHKADVAPGNSTKMLIMSRDEFVNGPESDQEPAAAALIPEGVADHSGTFERNPEEKEANTKE